MKNIFGNLINKYKKISLPAKASIWFVICNIFQKSISLLTTPIFTRMLTTEEYGTFSVYQSWYSILTIFATLYLFSGVYNNGIVKNPEDKNSFTSSMVGLTFACTSILVGIYLVNMSFWNNVLDLTTPLVIAIFVQSLCFAIFGFWSKQQRFAYKYRLLVLATFLMSITSPLLAIWLIKSFPAYKPEMRVWGFIIVNIVVSSIILLVFLIKSRKLFNWSYWKYALIFSWPLIPHYLSQVVLAQSDRIMINKFVGKSEAGIYALAYTISLMMTVVTQAINDSIIPYTYQKLKDDDPTPIKGIASGCVLLVGIGCCMAMLISPELIKIFASSDYYDAIKLMPIIAGAVFFMFLYTLYGNIEFYYEKTKFVMIASCFAAGLNVLLNYIFIPIYGYYAAAYTTLVSYVIYVLMHYLFSCHVCKTKLNMRSIYDNKIILLMSFLVVGFAFLCVFICDYIYIRIGIICFTLLMCIIFRKKILLLLKTILKKEKREEK